MNRVKASRGLWFCVFEASDLRTQRHQHYCVWPQAWHLILWGDQSDGSYKECSRQNFETHAKTGKIHQGAQELWWEIMTPQWNEWAILNIEMTCHLIVMISGASLLTSISLIFCFSLCFRQQTTIHQSQHPGS
jgi:hypothetical protein